jgi:hypothetical protein
VETKGAKKQDMEALRKKEQESALKANLSKIPLL